MRLSTFLSGVLYLVVAVSGNADWGGVREQSNVVNSFKHFAAFPIER